MGPEGNILVISPISTFQQGLTHSAMLTKADQGRPEQTKCRPRQTKALFDILFKADQSRSM